MCCCGQLICLFISCSLSFFIFLDSIDLEHGFKQKPEFKYLKAILLGDSSVNLRARVGKVCDSVEEQVDCLIDHATDPNILGRTYGGWEAWV